MVEVTISDSLDLEDTLVARVTDNTLQIVRIVHKSEYLGKGLPPRKWNEEHTLLSATGNYGEGLTVDVGGQQIIVED